MSDTTSIICCGWAFDDDDIKIWIPGEPWYCAAAQARARGLPGALEELGTCLDLNVKKDRRGKELIKLLCIPRKGVPSDA